MIIINSPI